VRHRHRQGQPGVGAGSPIIGAFNSGPAVAPKGRAPAFSGRNLPAVWARKPAREARRTDQLAAWYPEQQTGKAGMSFSFTGMMLANLHSIKDSDRGLVVDRVWLGGGAGLPWYWTLQGSAGMLGQIGPSLRPWQNALKRKPESLRKQKRDQKCDRSIALPLRGVRFLIGVLYARAGPALRLS
jgi:hypothetical protein